MYKNNKSEAVYLLPTRKSAIIFIIVVPLALAGGLAFFPLFDMITKPMPFNCFMADVLRINCPLCGGTRCVRALLELDIAQAFYYNPLVVAAIPVCIFVYIWVFVRGLKRDYRPTLGICNWHIWAFFIIVFGFFILRNLPVYRGILY